MDTNPHPFLPVIHEIAKHARSLALLSGPFNELSEDGKANKLYFHRAATQIANLVKQQLRLGVKCEISSNLDSPAGACEVTIMHPHLYMRFYANEMQRLMVLYHAMHDIKNYYLTGIENLSVPMGSEFLLDKLAELAKLARDCEQESSNQDMDFVFKF
jgi:hypothetical protein